jgi:hypothetical protein
MTAETRPDIEHAQRAARLDSAAWTPFAAEIPAALAAAQAMTGAFQRRWELVPPESALQLAEALREGAA